MKHISVTGVGQSRRLRMSSKVIPGERERERGAAIPTSENAQVGRHGRSEDAGALASTLASALRVCRDEEMTTMVDSGDGRKPAAIAEDGGVGDGER